MTQRKPALSAAKQREYMREYMREYRRRPGNAAKRREYRRRVAAGYAMARKAGLI